MLNIYFWIVCCGFTKHPQTELRDSFFLDPCDLEKFVCVRIYVLNTLIRSCAPLVLRLLEDGIPIINRVFDGFGDELSIATTIV